MRHLAGLWLLFWVKMSHMPPLLWGLHCTPVLPGFTLTPDYSEGLVSSSEKGMKNGSEN